MCVVKPSPNHEIWPERRALHFAIFQNLDMLLCAVVAADASAVNPSLLLPFLLLLTDLVSGTRHGLLLFHPFYCVCAELKEKAFAIFILAAAAV